MKVIRPFVYLRFRREQRLKSIENLGLHQWFAWRPVWTKNKIVWLEWVYRRGMTGWRSESVFSSGFSSPKMYIVYEYIALTKDGYFDTN